MKQVIQNFRSGKLAVEDVPAPALREHGVVVANRSSLISAGTEKSTVSVAQKSLLGKAAEKPDMVKKVIERARKEGIADTVKMVSSRLDTPAALGYSCAGLVLEVAAGVEHVKVGDRVACAGQNYASHAEAVFIPKNLCVKIPDKVSFEQASYVTLGAIALQGVRQAEPRLGDKVVVLGLGLLGQLTVQLLKANGCEVIAADIAEDKLELARRSGTDVAVSMAELEKATEQYTSGFGADSVIVTASTKSDEPVATAGNVARHKAKVVLVGAVGMKIPRDAYYVKELDVRMSMSYGPGRYDPAYEEGGRDYPYGYVRWTEQRNMEAFLALIASGKVDVDFLTTHTFPIDNAGSAYEMIMDNKEPFLGILLDYPRADSDAVKSRRIERASAAADSMPCLGVIGGGSHFKDMLLPAIMKSGKARIRAVCTATGMNAKTLADRAKAEVCVTDYHEILADEKISGVIIGTRHNLHASMVIDALKAGKHVFVEKPLCLTDDELEEIRTVYEPAAAKGQQLYVGFNRRFSPHAREIKACLDGRREPLVMCYRVNAGILPTSHWAQNLEIGGGRIVGEGCHFIDFMAYVCGSVPTVVSGMSIARHSSGITNDQSVMTLQYEDGSVGTVVYAAGGDNAMEKERFEVIGAGTSITMLDFMKTEIFRQGRKTLFKTKGRDKGFADEMMSFVDAVAGGSLPGMVFEEIWSVTRASILGDRSFKTGQRFEV